MAAKRPVTHTCLTYLAKVSMSVYAQVQRVGILLEKVLSTADTGVNSRERHLIITKAKAQISKVCERPLQSLTSSYLTR